MTTADRFAHPLPFGAESHPDGGTRFRLWAPSVDRITLEVDGDMPVTMTSTIGGWHEIITSAQAGAKYRFRLPNGMAVPDPASRLQNGDVHGHSVVVDPLAYTWRNTAWCGRPWHEAVIYEVHAGAMGGFKGLADRLEYLCDLGITAIEIMPVADFPGERNWGYDGVLPYAPDEAYGAPDDLKALIDKAHGLGLMVLLDVVYNHFGPDGAYLHVYAQDFFDNDKHTPWGAAIDFRNAEVSDYFIQNSLYWLMEYRFDGLRFDAVHTIADAQFLPRLSRTIRACVEPGRHVHLILENGDYKASLLGGEMYDAQWADDLHNAIHVMLTGERDGYYVDYQDAAPLLAKSLAEGFAYQGQIPPSGRMRGEPSAHLPPTAFVVNLQNHDQIGNRAMGERLTTLAHPESLCAASALLLLIPQIPMLFMGEETGSRTPFLFFTDHHADLAIAVRNGRRREFAHFTGFTDPKRRELIPDPNAPSTYEMSVPTATGVDPAIAALYRELLGLRHRHIIARIPGAQSLGAKPLGTTGVLARWRLGDGATLTVATNLGNTAVPVDAIDGTLLFECREGNRDATRTGRLPARCTVVVMQEST